MNKTIRNQFPSLSRIHNKKPFIFLDGPAGTQVPNKTINAISTYYKTSNANAHGVFLTTQETDVLLENTRATAAAFLGAEGGHTISFGHNMTTLNFSLSRAIGRILQPNDEILITQLDHEANRGPWLTLREKGIIVREVNVKEDGTLDYEDFATKINERTRLVAMGWASNIFGTINEVAKVRALTHKVGALLMIDAVHYAPHLPMDVQALGCDFLICSAYKFYGPHIGILYAKPGQLDRLPTDRLRTAYQHAPYSIETGTLNHAAIAGVQAGIEFIASMGRGKSLRAKLSTAMKKIHTHEIALAKQLYNGLKAMKKIQLYGPPMDTPLRAPTLSFTHKTKTATQVCEHLAKHNICAWNGHFYAIRSTEVLGLLEKGGVTRLGISVYNTKKEINTTLEVLASLR